MAWLRDFLRRQWLSLILAGILVILGLGLVMGPLGPRDLLALRNKQRVLEARRSELLAQNAELRTTVQELSSNDNYLEHLIRRELGFARPDERVYKFTGNPDESPR